jgi:hypothetical protein
MSGRQANDAADERTEREFVELSAKANAEQRSRLRASRTVLALATVILVETVVILVLLVAG